MEKPTIIFIPGAWCGPKPYETVSQTLQAHGYPTLTIPLSSTGKSSPGAPSLQDDIAVIRTALLPHVEAEKEIVLVMHSLGGLLGSSAIEGLGFEARAKQGRKGGVKKLVYLAAGLLPEGESHPEDLPLFDRQGGKLFCKDPKGGLFNDMSDAEAEKWIKVLECQPSEGWSGKFTYAGWKDVPSVYLACEKDAAVPFELQKKFAALAGSEIFTCSAAHMPTLSQPDKVVEVVRKAAGEAL